MKKNNPILTSTDFGKDEESNDGSQKLIEEESFDRDLGTHHSLGNQAQIHVGTNDLLRQSAEQQQRSTSSDAFLTKSENRSTNQLRQSFENKNNREESSSSSGEEESRDHGRDIKTITVTDQHLFRWR